VSEGPDLPNGRADADGQPHFTYYRKDLDWSFNWSGDFNDSIQVCEGGYGEPVSWCLVAEENSWMSYWIAKGEPEVHPLFFLEAFQWFCDQFVEAKRMTDEQDTFAELAERISGEKPELEAAYFKDLDEEGEGEWRAVASDPDAVEHLRRIQERRDQSE
jgi:hypothetical protein